MCLDLNWIWIKFGWIWIGFLEFHLHLISFHFKSDLHFLSIASFPLILPPWYSMPPSLFFFSFLLFLVFPPYCLVRFLIWVPLSYSIRCSINHSSSRSLLLSSFFCVIFKTAPPIVVRSHFILPLTSHCSAFSDGHTFYPLMFFLPHLGLIPLVSTSLTYHVIITPYHITPPYTTLNKQA